MACFCLLRRSDVSERTGLCKTAIYDRIGRGVFPRPVAIGPRTSAWPEHEVNAVIQSMVAGETEDQLRELVSDLLVNRKEKLSNDHKTMSQQ